MRKRGTMGYKWSCAKQNMYFSKVSYIRLGFRSTVFRDILVLEALAMFSSLALPKDPAPCLAAL